MSVARAGTSWALIAETHFWNVSSISAPIEWLLLVARGHRLGRILIHFRFRQNESRLAGAKKLQLFADFHFLLALAVSQAFDTLAQLLILARRAGITLLQVANL